MTILNILRRLPEIQSHFSFHREMSIVTLLELSTIFAPHIQYRISMIQK